MVFTDTETTGKNKNMCKVLSVAYIETDDDLDIIESGIEYLWQPDFERFMEPEALAIHHLTPELLAPFAPDYYPTVGRLFRVFQRNNIVAFNYGYDGAVLHRMFAESEYGYNPNMGMCAMTGTKFDVRARNKIGSLKFPSLDEALAHYKIGEEQVTNFEKALFPNHLMSGMLGHHSATWDTCALYLIVLLGGKQAMIRSGVWLL